MMDLLNLVHKIVDMVLDVVSTLFIFRNSILMMFGFLLYCYGLKKRKNNE